MTTGCTCDSNAPHWHTRTVTDLTARAEAAEAKVANVEALLWMWEAGQSHLGIERGNWGPSSSALRTALADEGDADE